MSRADPGHERENPGELIHIGIKKLGRIGFGGHRISSREPRSSNQRGRLIEAHEELASIIL
jgi:hypothetical protein